MRWDDAVLSAGRKVFWGCKGRVGVTLSYAQSLDGRLGVKGERTVLSSAGSLEVTHALRAAHDAIVVGVGTVLCDNPMLTVRGGEGDLPPSPAPVVIDTTLRTPPHARLLSPVENRPAPIILTANPTSPVAGELQAGGVRVVPCPLRPDGKRLDVVRGIQLLSHYGIRSVMVEGGAAILASHLAHGVCDAYVITIAPTYLGPGGIAVWDGAPLPLPAPSGSLGVGRDVILAGGPPALYPWLRSLLPLLHHP